MPQADVIVIGTGGVGSAAMLHLALSGAKVIGLDRFAAGHDRGSSHGQTRVIRQAYFEHPDYVPLLQRSYQLWKELAEQCETQLYFETGLLEVGPAEGVVVPGVLCAAEEHRLEVDQLTKEETQARFPGFQYPDDHVAVYEQQAGYLLVEECVRAHIQQAIRVGAAHHVGEAVLDWKVGNDRVQVTTDQRVYHAAAVVITAGAWSDALVQATGLEFRVLRKHLHWLANCDSRYHGHNGCPTFFFETTNGFFYGFPQIDDRGVKVAEHSGGEAVSDPLRVDRTRDVRDQQRVADFVWQSLPGVSTRQTHHEVCMYTMSPDEHFVIDRHPDCSRVVYAAGLSGHGFKFSSALGEALAAMVAGVQPPTSVSFLHADRVLGDR